MRNKQTFIVSLMAFSLVLSGCVPSFMKNEQDETVKAPNSEGESEEMIVSDDIKTSERYYRSVLEKDGEKNSLDTSKVRGLVTAGVDNRLDVDSLEMGLIRLSQEHYDPDKYFFKEGQLFDSDQIHSWLYRDNGVSKKEAEKDKKKKVNEGLNPVLGVKDDQANYEQVIAAEKKNPKFLSYIHEQDYYVQNKDEELQLGGISIALSLYSEYPYSVLDEKGLKYTGSVKLDKKEVIAKAKESITPIIKKIRAEHDVPIMFSLFMEQPRQSVVPGNFVASAYVEEGKSSPGSWKDLNEQYVAFPSSKAETEYPAESEKFADFTREIQDFFPNFVGVIGTGFYKQDKLSQMKVEIPIQFYSKAEVISFTQFVNGLVKKRNDTFPQDLPVSIYITNNDEPESMIVKDPNEEEPFVHIYQ
ncbi:CamS family sex pheromone protein [Pseudalkalibacillus hwajinpoensis]|uniref:CamS family sex pheromone protein n=1 Tax=Guptibacillus hwajinpoensis TaxID=208199 RepID=A0A4U1MDM0_9BACL|nr:CamS family sex pheromone protein [Pseudalkalibacillus hwajinpoensis]TKD68220.1 CamS family sex pheromone protein [Pseudalkalibacillus hwajinpoensis]